ncbi:MAG: hypothetical protein LBQ38_07425 [Spirochaetaceae bacterium]|jgi:hypothetical protein|nr:hypothetical protein [Spirochaetaceae bacterium]
MNKQTETGFASPQFLCMLFLVSALAGGIGCYLVPAIKTEEGARQYNRDYGEAKAVLRRVIAALEADPSPGTNGPEDPVWALRGTTENGYTLTIDPVSDRLNPNFVRKNVFEKTALYRLFKPGYGAEDLQQWREDQGLSLSAAAYQNFFDQEVFAKYFSCYGWANINLTDEFAARKLVFALTGSDYTAELIRRKIETLLIDRTRAGRESLRSILSIHYEELFPLINTEPLMNVNFIDPLLLKELIAYPDYKIPSPEQRWEELVNLRSAGTLDTGDILNVLGTDSTNPLLQYLGCITWFWELTISGGPLSCRAVVCRLPPEDADQDESGKYILIEERYY